MHGIVGLKKKKKKKFFSPENMGGGETGKQFQKSFRIQMFMQNFDRITKWIVVLHPFYTEPNWTVEKQFVRFYKFVTNQRTPVIY